MTFLTERVVNGQWKEGPEIEAGSWAEARLKAPDDAKVIGKLVAKKKIDFCMN